MEFDALDEMMPYDGKVIISQCEGPVTKNDTVREICAAFIPNGDRFYQVISRYDDALTNVIRKEGFKAGDASKLILPFLKAFGVTDQALVEHSRRTCMMIPGAAKTMRFVQEIMTPFMVSSSYEHYLTAVCDHIGFPLDNCICTKCSLDGVKIDEWEAQTLRDMAAEITALPVIEVPINTRTLKDFRLEDRKAMQRLDQIFWNDITDLASYHLVMETVPIGDAEKASTVVEVCKKVGVALEDCIYIGEGLTDAKAMNIVRKGGGLTISFNGNSYAVREADVAVMANNAVVTSMLAEAFYKAGKDAVLDMVDDWKFASLERSGLVHEYIVREAKKVFGKELPDVRRVTAERMSDIALRSVGFRKTVQGQPINASN
ncbi:MAG: hypothetical protein A4E32_01649 [Methanomassiliicoccales archaeon PtaU1.Bin124]|nr:MAG: hypothetical protein A4E32_01649 [Methanomassiliicoccales archaeon PtaU1.Bin124]